ncbi:hypothetical protein T265_06835 [Opisthorchis viverrini]|uniref:Uncharacterized protein n=1 Tax=Opisthorchis viverrini TaxID=6198 RepID=A0A074ZR38_OPIVI|nr:hypothetical protein T265_06835 [Opisthorchis viverrini]KER25805.1 hypothetical protein T265_06835 [Opisthorchis viverrini]
MLHLISCVSRGSVRQTEHGGTRDTKLDGVERLQLAKIKFILNLLVSHRQLPPRQYGRNERKTDASLGRTAIHPGGTVIEKWALPDTDKGLKKLAGK